MYGIAKDVSAQRDLEERLLRERGMFEAFMNHSPIVGWLTDERCVMHYMNDLYLATYGFTEMDFGKNIYEMFPKQIAVDYHLNNLRVIKEGKAIQTVEKAVLPCGKEQVLKIFKFPLVLDGVNMVAGWAVDISEQMDLEQALEKTVERYHYVDEATSDAIFEWDVKTNQVYRGSGFTRVFGSQFTDRPFESVYKADEQRVRKVVSQSLEDPAVDRYQLAYRFRHPDGELKHVYVRAFIRREHGKAVKVVGSVQDVTDQKRLQETLLRRERETKRQIVKSIIDTQEKERRKLSVELHDNVNQMLTSCRLMMEVALDGGAAAQSLLKKSHQSLQQIIDELRKISHDLNPACLHDLGLVESIAQLVENLNLTGKIHIDFAAKGCFEQACITESDRIAIFRIIQEQVSNIVRHARATRATIRLCRKERAVSIFMKDNGVGFDCKSVKKGLGFRNIKNRIEYYNGTFDVQSKIGEGTQSNILLFLAPEREEPSPQLRTPLLVEPLQPKSA